jgi:hypothetical protein
MPKYDIQITPSQEAQGFVAEAKVEDGVILQTPVCHSPEEAKNHILWMIGKRERNLEIGSSELTIDTDEHRPANSLSELLRSPKGVTERDTKEWTAIIRKEMDRCRAELRATPFYAWRRKLRLRDRISTGDQALAEIERVGLKEYAIGVLSRSD